MGIERSRQKLREAEIVLFLSDIHNSVEKTIEDFHNLALTKDQTGVILLNKADTISAAQSEPKTQIIADKSGVKTILITAKYKETLQPLLTYFSEYIQNHNQAEGTIISNTRHYEALENTKLCLQKVVVGLDSGLSSDFVAMDIREALFHLGTITGEVSTDDLLESIFSKFCIGK
jgi:tRNA modification GTPase